MAAAAADPGLTARQKDILDSFENGGSDTESEAETCASHAPSVTRASESVVPLPAVDDLGDQVVEFAAAAAEESSAPLVPTLTITSDVDGETPQDLRVDEADSPQTSRVQSPQPEVPEQQNQTQPVPSGVSKSRWSLSSIFSKKKKKNKDAPASGKVLPDSSVAPTPATGAEQAVAPSSPEAS